MSRPARDRERRLAAAPAVAAALAVVAVALAAPAPAAALEVPFLSGRVVDEAEILSPETEQGLTAQLEQLEQQTGAQVVVLTVPSLEGDPLEDYSLRVADTWQLGGAERDDGVLMLIARDDRQMRLEVGYGLEGTIPDILAGRILDQAVRPRFREGDFDAGVASGVGKVAALIRGEQPEAVLPEPESRGVPVAGCLAPIFWILFFFLVPILLGRRRRRFRVFGLPIVVGGFSGGSSRGGGWGGGGGFSGGGGSFGGGGASSSW